jgi:hypothetical protein
MIMQISGIKGRFDSEAILDLIVDSVSATELTGAYGMWQ